MSQYHGVFGVGPMLVHTEAAELFDRLQEIWLAQVRSLPPSLGKGVAERVGTRDTEVVLKDLQLMKHWFDPVASGRRLRDALDRIEPSDADASGLDTQLVVHLDRGRALITPEGRAAMWAISPSAHIAPSSQGGPDIYLSDAEIREALTMVHHVYREWTLQRLRTVTGLLQSETATLRPTVIGLLLVLLLNRNTSWERRLPSPENPDASAEVTHTVARPALAFARVLTGSNKASARGLDLYRGWALGEIARRLGNGLHRDRDGVWIDPEYEDIARTRLLEAIHDRPPSVRERVPDALQAALVEYERVRPVLSSLGLAHERPSNTRRLVEQVSNAASGDGDAAQ